MQTMKIMLICLVLVRKCEKFRRCANNFWHCHTTKKRKVMKIIQIMCDGNKLHSFVWYVLREKWKRPSRNVNFRWLHKRTCAWVRVKKSWEGEKSTLCTYMRGWWGCFTSRSLDPWEREDSMNENSLFVVRQRVHLLNNWMKLAYQWLADRGCRKSWWNLMFISVVVVVHFMKASTRCRRWDDWKWWWQQIEL